MFHYTYQHSLPFTVKNGDDVYVNFASLVVQSKC